MSDLDVSASSSQRLEVCVIDATGNKHSFEHAVTNAVVQLLQDAGVPLAHGSPKFLTTLASLPDAIAASANVILLFAHGDATDDDGFVTLAGDRMSWAAAMPFLEKCMDKVVLLCVCEGDNPISAEVLLRNAPSAMMLVASNEKVTSNQAKAFFPTVLRRLWQSSPTQIIPEHLRSIVSETSDAAGAAFKLHEK